MDVYEALAARHSVRGYLDREVAPETLERIFSRAQRAPSWCNIQPWRVFVASGATRRELGAALTAAAEANEPSPDFQWPYQYPAPYDRHRRECGKALYVAMGIERHDNEGRWKAWLRNFDSFGAPHMGIVCVDRRFGVYAAVDVGCWLQSLLLAAWSEGVAACPQASIATFPKAVRSVLNIPDELGVLFGLALGFEDPDHPANGCRTSREPLSENVTFVRAPD